MARLYLVTFRNGKVGNWIYWVGSGKVVVMRPDPVKLATVRAMAASGRARNIRQAARLSLAEIGAACGVDQASIWRWEMGRRSPRGEAALRYAGVLEALIRAQDTQAAS
jgi:DNA-binding transcriptional regulator YiaG